MEKETRPNFHISTIYISIEDRSTSAFFILLLLSLTYLFSSYTNMNLKVCFSLVSRVNFFILAWYRIICYVSYVHWTLVEKTEKLCWLWCDVKKKKKEKIFDWMLLYFIWIVCTYVWCDVSVCVCNVPIFYFVRYYNNTILVMVILRLLFSSSLSLSSLLLHFSLSLSFFWLI